MIQISLPCFSKESFILCVPGLMLTIKLNHQMYPLDIMEVYNRCFD